MTPDRATMERLLPHRGPAVWLDEVLHIDAAGASARTTLGRDLETPLLIEHMAQTIGLWAGHRAILDGGAPSVGYLVGSRRFECHVPRVEAGTTLDIVVVLHAEVDGGMALFDCSVTRLRSPIAVAAVMVASPGGER